MPDPLFPGAGFAWHAQRIADPWWVINLPAYGAFLFNGTESEAEVVRAHKANWEGEIAHKRCASFTDFPNPSRCFNHGGFVRARKFRFVCECGECAS